MNLRVRGSQNDVFLISGACKTLLDMGTGSAICLETLARTRLSMTSLSFRARACVSDKGVIGDSKQGAH